MKKLYALTLLLSIFIANTNIKAQESEISTNLDASIRTADLPAAIEKINEFVDLHHAVVLKQKVSEKNMRLEIFITPTALDSLQTLLPKLGFVDSQDITTSNNTLQQEKLELELDYLTEKKTIYEREAGEMTEKTDRYYNYWSEIREIEKRIFQINLELKSYKEKAKSLATIDISDDTYDLGSDKISWVNMPGASFDLLWMETPDNSISASVYSGYSLKYMITRGKTYCILGALKEKSEQKSDSSRFSEIFHLGFGQDFYTRHFGRGQNKFLNLYTGYNVGGLYATASNRSNSMFYTKVFLGVELFKNKYILLDNYVGYFIPLKFNRNMRGITYNISFNFVF